MTTPEQAATPDVFHVQAYERDLLREALVSRGFTDDGDTLVGNVRWTSSSAGSVSTTVTIEVGEAFPYGPPVVRLSQRHRRPTDSTPTFHLERNGTLCLYDDQVEVHDAGWRDPDRLLDQVAGWLENTDAGWPGDTDTDLERYLPQDPRLLRYDADELADKVGALKLDDDRVYWLAPVQERTGTRPNRRSGRRGRRVQPQGAFLLDAGELDAPVLAWSQVLAAAGDRHGELDQLVRRGQVRVVLLRYTRGGHPGLLALSLTRSGKAVSGVAMAALEAADISDASRRLRSGTSALSLSSHRVAVIGCGAVGSYVADSLLRSGVRRMTLVDHQTLRPGNVVRHLASDRMSGWPKVDAVRATLGATGLSVERIEVRPTALRTLAEAAELIRTHSLVIDACGDQRAAALLQAAAHDVGGKLVKVCLQREGGIARVDRWPLTSGEVHAGEVPPLAGLTRVRERGCGDLVSLTPPHAVLTAAALAVRTACAVLVGGHTQPSVVDVLTAQPDPPYDRAGLVLRRTASTVTTSPETTQLIRLEAYDPSDAAPGGTPDGSPSRDQDATGRVR